MQVMRCASHYIRANLDRRAELQIRIAITADVNPRQPPMCTIEREGFRNPGSPM